jgi:hypothetical protein
MSNQEKSIRDKYFAGELFRYGEIVEDAKTGAKMKILDRGSNYVTVSCNGNVEKRWLNEIKEEVALVVETQAEIVEAPKEFEILESGQIKMFGHDTLNFDKELSTLVIEQFDQFDDLYSKHQIVKCLDYAIGDSDIDRSYELLEKVESFYAKKEMQAPFIVEALKNDIERRRLAQIIAAVADIEPQKSNYNTVAASIKKLKEKYQSRKQWEVLWPLFKLASASGLDGILQSLPYQFDNKDVTEDVEDLVVCRTLEEHVELFSDEFEIDDVYESFDEEEFDTETMLSEVLSIEDRNKLGRKMSARSDVISAKRERALSRAATPDVLMSRARKLAETMVKRKMFKKAPSTMTRQDKERFEAGAFGRRALIAKLAQRLIGKVRALQSARIHHQPAAASHQVDHKAVETSRASGGAS